MGSSIELAVVVPVYNEERYIQSLIIDWEKMLNQLSIEHQFIIINDGSSDATESLLVKFAGEIPKLNVFKQNNMGHGPTIYRGYQLAMHATWVFQMDGDYQFEAELFHDLWQRRDHYDLLLGEREIQRATLGRKTMSQACRFLVQLLFGKQIRDVNSPYRLMRVAALEQVLRKIKGNSFAPNVLISSIFMAGKYRIFVAPLHQRKNAEIKKSKMNMRIIKGSLNSFASILDLRFKI